MVWNPAERNSEICTLKAREACRTLGMQLLEATVDQSKDVREAAESLVAHGVQAFWTGTDVTVLNATAALCDTAMKARIPVFSNTSGHVHEGTLFDLGANYLEVGHRIGGLAASILDGQDPATVVIGNFMPERVMLNKQVLKKMRDPWRFPDDLIARAALIIGEDGHVEKDASLSAPPVAAALGLTFPPTALATQTIAAAPPVPGPKRLARRWRIQQVSYTESIFVEDAMRGFRDGLKDGGLAEDRDFTLKALECAGRHGHTGGALRFRPNRRDRPLRGLQHAGVADGSTKGP